MAEARANCFFENLSGFEIGVPSLVSCLLGSVGVGHLFMVSVIGNSVLSVASGRARRRVLSLSGAARVSFDHLVGAAEASRECDAKRLGGLQIDHQFDLGRLLHRQVARFFAFEDASCVKPHKSARVGVVRSMAHRPPPPNLRKP